MTPFQPLSASQRRYATFVFIILCIGAMTNSITAISNTIRVITARQTTGRITETWNDTTMRKGRYYRVTYYRAAYRDNNGEMQDYEFSCEEESPAECGILNNEVVIFHEPGSQGIAWTKNAAPPMFGSILFAGMWVAAAVTLNYVIRKSRAQQQQKSGIAFEEEEKQV